MLEGVVLESLPKGKQTAGGAPFVFLPIFFTIVWNVVVMAGAPGDILDYEVTLRLICIH